MKGKNVAKKDTAIALIEWLKPSLKNALPKHLTADRMARIILTEFRRTPKLLNCTKESIAGAVLTAAQLGLEPGITGQCWILPYGKEATFVPGYQGMVELAYRSGQIDYITAEVVYEKDHFEFKLGTEPKLVHKPAIEEDRGELRYAYAVAKVKGSDTPVFKVLTKQEIEKVKKSSKSAYSEYSPWNTWPEEMWKKTALKKLLKLLPKSTEMLQLLEAEVKAEALTPQEQAMVLDVGIENDNTSEEQDKEKNGQEDLNLNLKNIKEADR